MLPSTEKIEKIITESSNKNPELLYESIILELRNSKFDFLFTELELGKRFHRIRVNEKSNKPYDKLENISYPPSEKSFKFNRANRPGQSMFYCSENPNIAEMELLDDYLMDNEIGQSRYCTYSDWEINGVLNLLVLAIKDKEKEYPFGLTLRENFNQFISTKNEAEQQAIIDQYSWSSYFFTKIAKDNKSVYVVCSAIANYLALYYDFDGFVFPSVQSGYGYNFAFKPYVIDKSLVTPIKKIKMQLWHKESSNCVSQNINCQAEILGEINGTQLIWDIQKNIKTSHG